MKLKYSKKEESPDRSVFLKLNEYDALLDIGFLLVQESEKDIGK